MVAATAVAAATPLPGSATPPNGPLPVTIGTPDATSVATPSPFREDVVVVEEEETRHGVFTLVMRKYGKEEWQILLGRRAAEPRNDEWYFLGDFGDGVRGFLREGHGNGGNCCK